jgi:hypothetical protein
LFARAHLPLYMVKTGLNNASLVRILSICFFAHFIHYIIAWYAQISWTPTYHITVTAARRVSGYSKIDTGKKQEFLI